MISDDERSFDFNLLFWDGETAELDVFVGSRNWSYYEAEFGATLWDKDPSGEDPQVVIWAEDSGCWLPVPLHSWILRVEYLGRAPWFGVMAQWRIEGE